MMMRIMSVGMKTVPDVLETKIITENDELIALRWLKAEPFLANEHLPIWTTMQYGSYIQRNYEVMKELGKFTTYYDLEKSSAVILLEEWNCIFGIIDVRYDIICLPLDQLYDHQHKVDASQYVKLLNHYDIPDHVTSIDLSGDTSSSSANQDAINSGKTTNDFNMLIKTWVDSSSMNQDDESSHSHLSQNDEIMNSPSTSCADGPPSQKRSRVTYKENVIIVYPEVLIVIPNDIVQTTQELSTLVLRYLVLYNAVAMLFAKLASQNIKIHINIAGIIIEKSEDLFPSSFLLKSSNNDGETILIAVADYLNSIRAIESFHQTLFTPDSFDFFILPTTYTWKDNKMDTEGISTEVHNLKIARQSTKTILPNKRLGSIVKHINIKHYINAAREIAHLYDDDPSLMERNSKNDKKQCNAIMHKPCIDHCPTCLTWSDKSIQSFKKYLSTNDNRCFLRNLPRSLHHPYNSPMKTLYPGDQCYCFGYSPVEMLYLFQGNFETICERKIRCTSINNPYRQFPLISPPIDGTPCEKNDAKVCWAKKCVSI
ncbi:hypothetical protein PV327_001820 [Microctonus hyperodae]|uniref:Uncharacterized protein n=1 Tax=Microctonus hyperodae TaxID=165561 RepID=A0AA39FEN7_MICHY|nr:hypothetical protein PV327_001820 [Microctonus hyperodae]